MSDLVFGAAAIAKVIDRAEGTVHKARTRAHDPAPVWLQAGDLVGRRSELLEWAARNPRRKQAPYSRTPRARAPAPTGIILLGDKTHRLKRIKGRHAAMQRASAPARVAERIAYSAGVAPEDRTDTPSVSVGPLPAEFAIDLHALATTGLE